MKIFGLIDNYGRAEREQGPSLIQFSDVSVTGPGKPFFVPADGHLYRAYPSVAIRIDRLGKTISPRHACRYYSEASFALNVRDESMLATLSHAGLPWTEAVSFDYSVPMGRFMPAEKLLSGMKEMHISLTDRAGNPCGESAVYRTEELRLNADEALGLLSRRFTVKNGDILLLGFPDEGIEIAVGQTIECIMEGEVLLKTKIR